MILIENVAIATADAEDTYYGDGHVVVGDDGRIVAVGPGHAGRFHGHLRRIDGTAAPDAVADELRRALATLKLEADETI